MTALALALVPLTIAAYAAVVRLAGPRLRKCEMRCEEIATVYAIDLNPDGWGGYWCEQCARNLGYHVVDRFPEGIRKGS